MGTRTDEQSNTYDTLQAEVQKDGYIYICNQTGTKVNKNIGSLTYVEKYKQIWR